MIDRLGFQECATCAAQPGSPTLCESCLHNRAALDARWHYAEEQIDRQRDWARREQRKAFMAGILLTILLCAATAGIIVVWPL